MLQTINVMEDNWSPWRRSKPLQHAGTRQRRRPSMQDERNSAGDPYARHLLSPQEVIARDSMRIQQAVEQQERHQSQQQESSSSRHSPYQSFEQTSRISPSYHLLQGPHSSRAQPGDYGPNTQARGPDEHLRYQHQHSPNMPEASLPPSAPSLNQQHVQHHPHRRYQWRNFGYPYQSPSLSYAAAQPYTQGGLNLSPDVDVPPLPRADTIAGESDYDNYLRQRTPIPTHPRSQSPSMLDYTNLPHDAQYDNLPDPSSAQWHDRNYRYIEEGHPIKRIRYSDSPRPITRAGPIAYNDRYHATSPSVTLKGAIIPTSDDSDGIEHVIDGADEAPLPTFLSHVSPLEEEAEPRSYQLTVRQAPKHGQMCTLGSKTRRILDPLPIIQLDVRNRHGRRDTVGQANPFLLMQVHLIAEHIDDGAQASMADEESTSGPNSSLPTPLAVREADVLDRPIRRMEVPILPAPHQTKFATQRLLEGKLTSSASIVRETLEISNSVDANTQKGNWIKENEERSANFASKTNRRTSPSSSSLTSEGGGRQSSEVDDKMCFFLFPDLSIRTCGIFRLSFSLLRLESGQIVAQCSSEPFQVVHPRDFDGLWESTPLAKALANQGVHIPIRNETRWRSGIRSGVTIAGDE